jgi:hypothetical protein
MDFEFIEADRLGQSHYLKIGDYNIPYVGIIPKIIDYELSVLDDKIFSIYKLQAETDDILQLLFDIKTMWGQPNQIGLFIDKLLGVDIGETRSYFQVTDIIARNGGMPTYESLLNSKYFEYSKGDKVDKDQIWGSW